MWEFIKYCILCMLLVLSASFGNSYEALTFKNIIVGIITMFVCCGLFVLFVRLSYFIDSKLYDRKMKKEGLQKQDGQGEQNEEPLTEEPEVKEDKEPEVIDEAARRKKKKIYTIIAWICFSLPILFLGVVGIYCAITGFSLKGNFWWAFIVLGVCYTAWLVFYIMAGMQDNSN